MKSSPEKRVFIAWLALVGITLLYLLIDHAADNGVVPVASTAFTVAAMCLACVKVRVIMREFMEARSAPPFLCRITDAWVVLMAVALIGTYLGGRTVA
jgi:hypothetical protein